MIIYKKTTVNLYRHTILLLFIIVMIYGMVK